MFALDFEQKVTADFIVAIRCHQLANKVQWIGWKYHLQLICIKPDDFIATYMMCYTTPKTGEERLSFQLVVNQLFYPQLELEINEKIYKAWILQF